MIRLILRSFVVLVGSALAGSLVVFALLRMLKGDVASVMLGINATPESLAVLRERLGLNEPWFAQYFDWMLGMLRGDLGRPYFRVFDVSQQVRARIGLTVSLAVAPLLLSAFVSLVAGSYAAVQVRKRRGALLDLMAQIGIAVPSFWVGILLIAFVSVRLGWLPAGGYVPWSTDPIGAIRTLTLPVLALSLSLSAALTRYVRSAMLDVVNEDYIRTALAKGRTLRAAVVVHGIRNASVPLVTVGTLTLGGLLTGVVVIEVVFSLPGLGRMLLDAVLNREVIVVQSLTFVFLLLILTLNFFMDVGYGLLDPRIRDAQRMP